MKLITTILLWAGILLLGINIYGLFKTMRNPAIYDEEKIIHNRIGDVTIKYPDIKNQLARKNGESNVDFAVRINKVVNDGFAHYWKSEGIESIICVYLFGKIIFYTLLLLSILKSMSDTNSVIIKKTWKGVLAYVPVIHWWYRACSEKME